MYNVSAYKINEFDMFYSFITLIPTDLKFSYYDL